MNRVKISLSRNEGHQQWRLGNGGFEDLDRG